MKISCCGYSFRQYLKDGGMSLEDFLDKAVEMGIDGVELTAYYFPTTETDYLSKLKREVFLRGLDISGTAVGNNFCQADPQRRREQIEMVKRWVDISYHLGAPCMRVFAGGVPEGHTEEEAFGWVVDALRECVEYTAPKGVILALENHGGITSTADQVLKIYNAVSSEWLGINLDTGNFRADPYNEIAKVAPYAVTTHAKTDIYNPQTGKREKADFARISDILREAGYRGYISIEYEEAEDPMTAVPRFVEYLKGVIH
jgi:sugar phosphate isomerase/epimerase